jgi:hypothetical protein
LRTTKIYSPPKKTEQNNQAGKQEKSQEIIGMTLRHDSQPSGCVKKICKKHDDALCRIFSSKEKGERDI